MKCPECKGKGSDGEYDGVRVDCSICDGAGRVRRMEHYSIVASVWWSSFKDRMATTRVGRWWWRVHGLEARARWLAKRETYLQLSARHGHSMRRMKVFAKAVEDGHNVQFAMVKERRLMELYDLACKMRHAIDKWQPEQEESRP